MSKERKQFFFEKKNQETFATYVQPVLKMGCNS
jgi:hypothetical protein